MRAAGDHLHLRTVGPHFAKLVGRTDRREEPKLVVAVPGHIARIVIEILCQILLLARGEHGNEQAVFVRLVAIAFHAGKSHHAVIRREAGIFVVTHHPFRDIDGRPCSKIVNINVGIGAERVLLALHLLAGVGQLRARAVPRDLGRVEIGRHRRIPRLARHDVHTLGHPAVFHLGNEQVQVTAVVPVIPVTRHQVVVDQRLRVGQVGEDLRRLAFFDLDTLDVIHFVAFGRKAVPFDTALDGRKLAQVAAVGSGAPQLRVERK